MAELHEDFEKMIILHPVDTISFPKLFTTDSKGKSREWTVCVEIHENHSNIICKSGLSSGKFISSCKTINYGKNIGKSNSTNHIQQAKLEATSKWNNKKDSGYGEYLQKSSEFFPSPDNNNKGEISTKNVSKFSSPMLSHEYSKRCHDLVYPLHIQPKLDGVRCVYNNGVCYSRNGKVFSSLINIISELQKFKNEIQDMTLDGEIYQHGMPFQTIISLVKVSKWNVLHMEQARDLKYYIFDYIPNNKGSENISFIERYTKLEQLFSKCNFQHLVLVDTHKVDNIEQAYTYYDVYNLDGYEGIMFRNSSSFYKTNYRSKDLQKMKPVDTDEFKIVGYKEGVAAESGCVIWLLQVTKTVNNIKNTEATFTARPKGTREQRAIQFQNGQDYIGKMATVKYQGTSVEGIPRFPIVTCIRDYE